jgi:LPXTG-motif cell wall-anchored protein
VRVTTPNNGFDYGDAGIGAAAMAGLALLGAAATLAIRRRSQLRRT